MISTLSDLDTVRGECLALVRNRSLLSAGAAVLPIPALDVVADFGLLQMMLPEISRRFGLDTAQLAKLDPRTAERVLAVANRLGSALIGKVVTDRLVLGLMRRLGLRLATGSVAKFVPIVGSALAAGLSFGAMTLIGERHIADCYETVRQSLLADE